MDARIKKLWLEALRFGEYRQGRGTLVAESDRPSTPDSFCCLGVLTDIYVEETGDASVWQRESRIMPGRMVANDVLAPRVRDWAGLPDIDPEVSGATLSSYNDDHHYRLATIADLIEKGL